MQQIGNLDGITGGELSGWAYDSDRLDEALKLTVHVNRRPVAEMLAGYYRPDVAAHFQSSGRHGFYVDLTRICPLADASIDVRLPTGELLQGAPIQASVPRPSSKQGLTLVFIHIPKTAGTSIRQAILSNYKRSEVIYLYPQEPGFPIQNLNELPLDQRARTRLIVGHWAHYGIHEQIPNDCLYFTVVRDPVSRVWSNYTHLMQSQDPRVLGDARRGTLQEMLESKSRPDLDNLMVRYFAGLSNVYVDCVDVDLYELARQHLHKAFPYIGLQHNVADAYALLQERLGWKSAMPMPVMNVTEYDSSQPLTESDKKLIRHFNKWDCKLYDEIVRHQS